MCRLMASIFKTPVSLLTLIVDDRVWFKSKVRGGADVLRPGRGKVMVSWEGPSERETVEEARMTAFKKGVLAAGNMSGLALVLLPI